MITQSTTCHWSQPPIFNVNHILLRSASFYWGQPHFTKVSIHLLKLAQFFYSQPHFLKSTSFFVVSLILSRSASKGLAWDWHRRAIFILKYFFSVLSILSTTGIFWSSRVGYVQTHMRHTQWWYNMSLQVRASLQSTGIWPEVIVSAAHELNFTKSNMEKSWLNSGSPNVREVLAIVLGPRKRFPIPISVFTRARGVREDAVEAKTSFGQPSINKALLNLGK